ncbi:tRNA pseudouridine(55) synthase TruB [Scrofimicrobium sp. R131]|uniref:tRNA pseudouridine synthase B n=1 Tax=Scrofimicrobium appendicitidis TaxID=3079930 RepID=A0AAU7V532_9ACTO
MSSAGILLVDKPAGLTSHDVVGKVRRLARTRAVGHAGTLDPAATGLLILGVNRGTKLLTYLTGLDKTYRATIRLGADTTTDDAEGEVLSAPGCPPLAADVLEAALAQFRGRIQQVPASVSAIKVDGKRAHALVRAGQQVELAARPVTILRLEQLGPARVVDQFLDLDVEVECSSGTYIRSLARDLGRVLGVGGHLTSLRRTTIGPWTVAEATPLADLPPDPTLLSFDQVCPTLFPLVEITPAQAERFRYGQVPELDVTLAEGEVRSIGVPGANVAGLVQVKSGRLKPAFIIQPI